MLRRHISARVLTGTWAEEEASHVQTPFAGISYVVFRSWDLGKPLSCPYRKLCHCSWPTPLVSTPALLEFLHTMVSNSFSHH